METLTQAKPASSPVFTFDQNAHAYYLDGVEIPHVTGILHAAGLVPDYGGFHEAQWRGLHVHSATEWLDLNDLDWSTVYPQWVGYVRAYERFKQETGFLPELIEYQSYHQDFRFGGTIDRVGRLDGKRVLIDLKTGAEEPHHAWQTAAYSLLVPVERRGCVYLFEDGKYKITWHDNLGDVRVFLAALTVANIKGASR